MNPSEVQVFTIGHSNHPAERFITLLQGHGVTAVADVRSSPFSRFNPQFNRETLESTLKANKIAYVFLGRELGARSEDPSCYENGRVQYERLAKTELFQLGMKRVLTGAESHRVALMCAEKDPVDCHRTLLVARQLDRLGVGVSHILADGTLEPHAAAMTRLLRVIGLPEVDMFRSREELLEEARIQQEQRIAYQDENVTTTAGEGSA